jgi:putative salt-induced outer membrane protein YdiY
MPSIIFDNNRRLIGNLTVEVPISKKIQLRSSFDYTYEGIVPANVKKTDTRTLIGLVIGNM